MKIQRTYAKTLVFCQFFHLKPFGWIKIFTTSSIASSLILKISKTRGSWFWKLEKQWNQSLLIKSKNNTTLVVINLVQVSSRYCICHKFSHDDFSCAPHGFHEFVYCHLCRKMKTIVLVRYLSVLGPSSKLCLWWLCDVVNQQTNNYHCWLVLYFFSISTWLHGGHIWN